MLLHAREREQHLSTNIWHVVAFFFACNTSRCRICRFVLVSVSTRMGPCKNSLDVIFPFLYGFHPSYRRESVCVSLIRDSSAWHVVCGHLTS